MVAKLQISVAGRNPSQRIEFVLQEGDVVRAGRAPATGWTIPWDPAISREHMDLHLRGGKLRVACLQNARNALIYRGNPTRELIIDPGDWFQVGQTTITAGVGVDATEAAYDFDAEGEPGGDLGSVYTAEQLKRVSFRNSEQQMEVLAQLPQVIAGAHSDEELVSFVSKLLLLVIPQAEAVSVAHFDETLFPRDESEIAKFPKPLTMQLETRDSFRGRVQPSRRMIAKALRQQASVMYIWGEVSEARFTVSEGLGWAFCSPIRGESCQGWCIYVSGKGSTRGGLNVTEEDLASDLRFTELVAQFIGSVRQIRLLEEQKTRLSSFFSPKVIENLTNKRSHDLLAPAEREISVLFCDVRGFSRKSEQLANDLPRLFKCVGAALGVMTSGILERDGAIADFQGDAALGFWGWPVELENGPVPACEAALTILREFQLATEHEGNLLEGFTIGMGVAHGRALAGQIGPDKQAKVGVFGPVVNQGSRLEGLTKQFSVPICIDERTAEYAQRLLSPATGRLRKLARVRPNGMDTPLTVFGLLPPEHEWPQVTSEMIREYEAAVDEVVSGDWKTALSRLERLPESDGPKQFLLQRMSESNFAPPADWSGAFSLQSK